MVTSVLSLSWGAARSFLIMRSADKADPDPDMATVMFYIWPLTLVSGLKTEYSNQRLYFVFYVYTDFGSFHLLYLQLSS